MNKIENGVASYVITSNTAELAQDIQDALIEPESLTTIEESLPITVDSYDLDTSINAEVVVTVDTSGAENNLNRAAETLEESFTNQGYDAEAESNFYQHFT